MRGNGAKPQKGHSSAPEQSAIFYILHSYRKLSLSHSAQSAEGGEGQRQRGTHTHRERERLDKKESTEACPCCCCSQLELEPELITPALMGPNNAKWSSATSGAGGVQGETAQRNEDTTPAKHTAKD